MHPAWVVALALLVLGGIPALAIARRVRREIDETARAVGGFASELGSGARSLGSELGRLEERAETTTAHTRAVLDAARGRSGSLRRRR